MAEPEGQNPGHVPKKVFTPEFKLKAVMLVQEGATKAQVSRQEGIAESTLRGWCKNVEKIAIQVRSGTNPDLRFQASPEERTKAAAKERLEVRPHRPLPAKRHKGHKEEALDLSMKYGNMPDQNDSELANAIVANPNCFLALCHLNRLTPMPLVRMPLHGFTTNSPFPEVNSPSPGAPVRGRHVLSEVQPSYPGTPTFRNQLDNMCQIQDPKLMMGGMSPNLMAPAMQILGDTNVENKTIEEFNSLKPTVPIFKHYRKKRKRSLHSVANGLSPQNKDRSLEESLKTDSVEKFSAEEALKHGERFLRALEPCSHSSISRGELLVVESLVAKLRTFD